MSPYYAEGGVTVYHGDCLEVLAELPDASVDSVVCDPPYDLTNRTPDVLGCESCGRTLGGRDGKPDACPRCGAELTRQRSKQGKGFMGKEWDGTGIAFRPEVWIECLRVLKPGGHLLAFGGTRTWHRLACAVEDAGFEVRDSIAWLYGSGFPKSLDVSKAIDKAAGAEREVVGSKLGLPGYRDGDQIASTVLEGGASGALNNGSAKLHITAPATADAARWQGWGTAMKPAHEPVKPLDLMRWLVRLVCPPGGTVLEPFAGSGTTVEACILEGFRCIAIEREADYMPLITQRIHRRIDPVAAVKASGDDGGLFDLLGEETA